jgi:hypothetical protein
MSFKVLAEEFPELTVGEAKRVLALYRSEREREHRLNKLLDRSLHVLLGIVLTAGIAILVAGFSGYSIIQPAGYIAGFLFVLIPAALAAYKYMEPESISLIARIVGKTVLRATPIVGGVGIAYEQTRDSTRINGLQDRIADIEQRLAANLSEQSKADYSSLTDELTERVYRDASIELVSSVERRLNSLERTDLYDARHALEIIAQTRARMTSTLTALSKRGAINLIIGGFITCVGAILLYKFVLIDSVTTQDPIAYALHFLPRLAIVGLIQIFALFFLRLYKLGLEEIKYFQNEMTNIEQRELALSVALLQDDTSVRSSILELIAATDRNNVLEKGQSTIEIEKARIENNGSTVEALKNIIPLLVRQK